MGVITELKANCPIIYMDTIPYAVLFTETATMFEQQIPFFNYQVTLFSNF